MADEIIVLERSGQQQSFAFYYSIPAAIRIEVGGAGSGVYPVMTPTGSLGDMLLSVLTQDEKDDLDAGAAAVFTKSFMLDPATPEPQLLAYAREMYAAEQAVVLADYQSRYSRIGQRFDKDAS